GHVNATARESLRGRDRFPSERSRKKVKEPQRRELDACEALRDPPILTHAPEKVGRWIGGEEAVHLPVELQPTWAVCFAPCRLEGAVDLRILVKTDVLAVRRRLARMEIRVLIEVGRQKRVGEGTRLELARFHALRVCSPVERAKLQIHTDLLVGLLENLRDVRVD